MGGILEVVLKIIACTVVYNGIILLLFGRTEEFKILWGETMKLIRGFIERNFKKKKEDNPEGDTEGAEDDSSQNAADNTNDNKE